MFYRFQVWQPKAALATLALAPLAYSVRKTYSAFANGTNEITFLPHTKKATVQTRRVLHSPSKGGKGRDRRGRGKRGSKEENRREREGREMPPFVPVLSFSLPSLSRRCSSLAVPPLNRCRKRKQSRPSPVSKRAEQANRVRVQRHAGCYLTSRGKYIIIVCNAISGEAPCQFYLRSALIWL